MDKRIEEVINFVKDNLDLTFHLKSLANVACLSTSQFHRLFKKETNKTPFQFVEGLKLKKAYDLIIHSDISIQKLTIDLGYKDYETFSRAFKRKFNFSPDDLKAIFKKLNETFEGVEKEGLIVASVEITDEELLIDKIHEIMLQLNIDQEDIKESEIFKVLKKSNNSVEKDRLIKNKYELKNGKEIKKLLLK